ncbi:MAG: hypothetical protein A2V67_15740 [Deltaproteobacteria bacterium RBG_13_61_14]|nr:MAG: hypothetical protein A2V67_15740 [Deltaproteobacteria bacterium RBG_13_61_14]
MVMDRSIGITGTVPGFIIAEFRGMGLSRVVGRASSLHARQARRLYHNLPPFYFAGPLGGKGLARRMESG